MVINLGPIFWILLLFLLLTGTIGSFFSIIFGIIGFFLLLALVGAFILRRRIRKAQQEAYQQAEQFRNYTWNYNQSGGNTSSANHHTQTNPNEGRVRVSGNATPQKRVNDDVGEYVDFEEN